MVPNEPKINKTTTPPITIFNIVPERILFLYAYTTEVNTIARINAIRDPLDPVSKERTEIASPKTIFLILLDLYRMAAVMQIVANCAQDLPKVLVFTSFAIVSLPSTNKPDIIDNLDLDTNKNDISISMSIDQNEFMINLSEMENDLFDIINELRSNPQSFITQI